MLTRKIFSGNGCFSRLVVYVESGAEGFVLAGLLVIIAMVATGCGNWRDKLARELPVMGHRNWIVVADSAYPAQSRSGIETIATGSSQIEVATEVLKVIDEAGHINANVYLDAEMKFVSEKNAPGINAYRNDLSVLLGDKNVNVIPHEELIAKLDEAAKTFRVLILKTNLSLPYTSVFLELDCGYWNAEAEKQLRDKMSPAK